MLYEATQSLRPNRHWMRGPLTSVVVAMLLGLPGIFVQTGTAFAEERRFHVGIVVPVEYLEVSFEKSVDNTDPNTLVPEPRRGMVFQDEDSANTSVAGIGLLAGYRLPLAESGFYLSGEIDIAFHRGTAEGQLRGIGTSARRNQLGESWPDHWSLGKDRSYGFTLKLSGNPEGVLRSWDASLYALGGFRLIEARFTTRFNGCLSSTPCTSAEDTPDFASGIDSRGLNLQGWTAGIGMEKMLGERLALHAETRYTQYGGERWVTPFDDVGVRVPTSVDADEVSLLLRLGWSF